MSRVSNLFRLQEIDLEIDAARVRLAEIDQALRGDPAVQAARARLIAAENELRTARVSAQELEFESASLAAKISDAEQRLYSGRIRNPKELQDLQADIASLKRRRAAVEERQLDALIEAEKADTTAAGSQTELTQAETAAARFHSQLNVEQETLVARTRRLEAERETLRVTVGDNDRQVYDRLRQAKHGRAVSRFEDGACAACGLEPTPAVRQEARRGTDLVRCPGCDRILYVE